MTGTVLGTNAQGMVEIDCHQTFEVEKGDVLTLMILNDPLTKRLVKAMNELPHFASELVSGTHVDPQAPGVGYPRSKTCQDNVQSLPLNLQLAVNRILDQKESHVQMIQGSSGQNSAVLTSVILRLTELGRRVLIVSNHGDGSIVQEVLSLNPSINASLDSKLDSDLGLDNQAARLKPLLDQFQDAVAHLEGILDGLFKFNFDFLYKRKNLGTPSECWHSLHESFELVKQLWIKLIEQTDVVPLFKLDKDQKALYSAIDYMCQYVNVISQEYTNHSDRFFSSFLYAFRFPDDSRQDQFPLIWEMLRALCGFYLQTKEIAAHLSLLSVADLILERSQMVLTCTKNSMVHLEETIFMSRPYYLIIDHGVPESHSLIHVNKHCQQVILVSDESQKNDATLFKRLAESGHFVISLNEMGIPPPGLAQIGVSPGLADVDPIVGLSGGFNSSPNVDLISGGCNSRPNVDLIENLLISKQPQVSNFELIFENSDYHTPPRSRHEDPINILLQSRIQDPQSFQYRAQDPSLTPLQSRTETPIDKIPVKASLIQEIQWEFLISKEAKASLQERSLKFVNSLLKKIQEKLPQDKESNTFVIQYLEYHALCSFGMTLNQTDYYQVIHIWSVGFESQIECNKGRVATLLDHLSDEYVEHALQKHFMINNGNMVQRPHSFPIAQRKFWFYRDSLVEKLDDSFFGLVTAYHLNQTLLQSLVCNPLASLTMPIAPGMKAYILLATGVTRDWPKSNQGIPNVVKSVHWGVVLSARVKDHLSRSNHGYQRIFFNTIEKMATGKSTPSLISNKAENDDDDLMVVPCGLDSVILTVGITFDSSNYFQVIHVYAITRHAEIEVAKKQVSLILSKRSEEFKQFCRIREFGKIDKGRTCFPAKLPLPQGKLFSLDTKSLSGSHMQDLLTGYYLDRSLLNSAHERVLSFDKIAPVREFRSKSGPKMPISATLLKTSDSLALEKPKMKSPASFGVVEWAVLLSQTVKDWLEKESHPSQRDFFITIENAGRKVTNPAGRFIELISVPFANSMTMYCSVGLFFDELNVFQVIHVWEVSASNPEAIRARITQSIDTRSDLYRKKCLERKYFMDETTRICVPKRWLSKDFTFPPDKMDMESLYPLGRSMVRKAIQRHLPIEDLQPASKSQSPRAPPLVAASTVKSESSLTYTVKEPKWSLILSKNVKNDFEIGKLMFQKIIVLTLEKMAIGKTTNSPILERSSDLIVQPYGGKNVFCSVGLACEGPNLIQAIHVWAIVDRADPERLQEQIVKLLSTRSSRYIELCRDRCFVDGNCVPKVLSKVNFSTSPEIGSDEYCMSFYLDRELTKRARDEPLGSLKLELMPRIDIDRV